MDTTPLLPPPQHIAIIMDGNGRWAAARKLPRSAGHRAGAQAVQATIEAAADLGVKYLTLYAFSTENWARPQEEIHALMDLLERTLDEYQNTAKKQNLRLLVSGAREPLPAAILQKINTVTTATRHHTGLTVNLALNYGARQEIIHAVNKCLSQGKTNLTEQDISAHLYQPDLPDPELLIRTSGEMRISNFLLWQLAYTELYFTPLLWPDFNKKELQKAIAEYQHRSRRFGAL